MISSYFEIYICPHYVRNKCWIYKPGLSFPLLKGTLSLKMLSRYVSKKMNRVARKKILYYSFYFGEKIGVTPEQKMIMPWSKLLEKVLATA